jgi:hypothetical protein
VASDPAKLKESAISHIRRIPDEYAQSIAVRAKSVLVAQILMSRVEDAGR